MYILKLIDCRFCSDMNDFHELILNGFIYYIKTPIFNGFYENNISKAEILDFDQAVYTLDLYTLLFPELEIECEELK